MKARTIIVFCVLLATLAMAAEQDLEELKTRAKTATPAEQVNLYLGLAQRQVKAAEEAYNRGEAEKGKAAIEETALSCEKAGAAARQSGKRMKQTEIHLRDLQRKLDGIRRSLSFDDRPTLQTAIERLEKVRADLLFAMFGTKS